MKRVNQIFVLLLVLATATMILHAGTDPGTAEKRVGVQPPNLSPAISPSRQNILPKRFSTARAMASTPQTPATASEVLAKMTISPPTATVRNFIEPTTGMEFLPVPGGCFQMGDNNGDTDEKPAHQICLDDYYIGKFEVTQGQWQQLMGTRPSFFSSCGDSCPVESVSWQEAQDFIAKLNQLNGRMYRLLTEAEWEYACRSGGKAERYCGSNNVDEAAWYDKNSSSQPHPVGEKQPNGLGVYDMSGNVWEWVTDRYQKSYYSSAPPHNPEGPGSGPKRVIRGGSWYNDPRNVRALLRGADEPDHRSINLGIRLAYSTR